MMPETCWEIVKNKHLTVASCWFSLSLHNLLTMHGHRHLKLANAQQAREIFQFKTNRQLLHKTTAAIWFNKTCRAKQLTPTYISIKINGNNRRDRNTIRATTYFRLTQEIKFLHTKNGETKWTTLQETPGLRGRLAQLLANNNGPN